ncbi:hypothetical protein LWI28_009282 [Acer negundo]|uniref:Protein NIM1-INTERACTING 2-like n=1 Tax=Acer negundo TaxID=4023 RepID=A0AAD5IME2_ACENE|nr:hypothetical protein LWI28_009282 [Acer negundo]KAK4852831.1 hypothetical protein QYF36_027410 [Acer negundo]
MSKKEKRKLGENDAVAATQNQKKFRDDNGEDTAVNVEEIEEFFAILRRIHVAVDYFKKGNGNGPRLTEIENIDMEANEAKDEVKPGFGDKNVGLDLNADPGTDLDPV